MQASRFAHSQHNIDKATLLDLLHPRYDVTFAGPHGAASKDDPRAWIGGGLRGIVLAEKSRDELILYCLPGPEVIAMVCIV